LVEQQRRNPSALGFGEVLNAIDNRVFSLATGAGEQDLANVTQSRFVSSLIDLSLNQGAQPSVRAIADAKLRAIANRLEPSLFSNAQARTQNAWLQERIEAHLNRPAAAASAAAPAVDVPPGSPIGGAMMETCWHCEGLGD
jgi:hypothetical protein